MEHIELSDEEKQEINRKNEERRQILMAFRECFATDAGQKVMETLEKYVAYKFPSYQAYSDLDGMATAMKAANDDGRKDVVAYIHNMRETPLPLVEDKQLTAE